MNVADCLAKAHFTARGEAAKDLERVEVSDLEPMLRGLLFTDGTVSRALEAQTLSPVVVDILEQAQAPVSARLARYLELEEGEQCTRRRIAMKVTGTPRMWAESHLVPRRLPSEFAASLDGNSVGIGGSLQQLRLESWRELLWFGLGAPPRWAGEPAEAKTLTRVYRIITKGRPALLICEAFAVESRTGEYCLRGAGECGDLAPPAN